MATGLGAEEHNYDKILNRPWTTINGEIKESGWYQCAVIYNKNYLGKAGILILEKTFFYTHSQSVILAISTQVQGSNVSILTNSGNKFISKVRIVDMGDGRLRIDFYINCNIQDVVGCTSIGALYPLPIEPATIPEGYTVTEFDI